MQYPGVRESAVVVNETAATQKQLIAFYTLSEGDVVEPDELRTYMNRRLSRHLVPSIIVPLDHLPRLKSGKIDTAGLLQRVGRFESRSSSPPSTDTERRLAELWTKLLKLEQVGATDEFFALGGDSL